jgi:hypothetical protein
MGRLGFCLSAGTLLMIIGGFPLFVVCGFASMGIHGLEGWDYWRALFERMFNFSNDAWCFSVPGSLIFLGGAGLLFYGIFAAIADGIRWAWRAK